MTTQAAPQSTSTGARSNLREFLDDLPRSPCTMGPSFGLCTVCFRINENVAISCPVYQEHRKGMTAEGSDREAVSASAGVPLPTYQDSIAQLRAELEEVPEFEFIPPPKDAPEEEIFDAEVIEAEVIEEPPVTPKAPAAPVPRPKPKLKTPAPSPAPSIPTPAVALPARAPPAPTPAPLIKRHKKAKTVKLKVAADRPIPKSTTTPPPAGTPGVVVPPPTPAEISGEVPLPSETPSAPKAGFEVVEDEAPKPGAA